MPGLGREGQAPFIATERQRADVMKYIACGFNNESISIIMAIPLATLERHFRWELTNGKTMVDAKILGGIVDMASEGDKTMSIFYARSRGGWRQDGGKEEGQIAASFNIQIGGSASDSAPEINIQTIKVIPHEPEEP